MMPVFVMGLFVSVLFCGLSLDIGMLELQKTQMQTAVDAAAIAEDMRFERQTNINGSDGVDAAAVATSYGYTNGVNNTTVTFINSLSRAAIGGDYNGHYDVVQVTITRQVQTLFMGLLNGGIVTVAATGIASPPPCEYFLGTKNLVPTTVVLANTAAIGQTYVKCPAYIGGSLAVPAGAWWQHFQTYLTGSPATSFLLGRVKQGTTFNAVARADPLASIVQPPAGACNYLNYNYNNLLGLMPPVTLNPGTYCGTKVLGIVTPGLTLYNANVTFNPGLYIITGGANWQRSTVTGNGVTFFFTNVAFTNSYGLIITDVYSTHTLNAATGGALGSYVGGALSGILFFCDRNWVNTTTQDFQWQGYGNYQGILYMPYTGLAMQNGIKNCNGYCATIADNLYLANFSFHSYGTDYTMFTGVNPMRANSVLVQ